MADSLIFDGSNDRIEYNIGDSASLTSYTGAFIWKRGTTSSTWTQFSYFVTDITGPLIGIGIDGSAAGKLVSDQAGQQIIWSATSLGANTSWLLGVIHDPGGTGQLTASIYNYTTATWIHTDILSGFNQVDRNIAIGDIYNVGSWMDGGFTPGDYWNGNLLIGGWWYNRVLTSTERDSLRFSRQNWVDLTPDVAHRFDATTPTSFGIDTPTFLQNTGASVDVGDVPAGWDDTLGPPPVPPAGTLGNFDPVLEPATWF